MTSTADQPIAALRSGLDQLAAHVQGLTPEQISGPSGASEWTVADVLSHLGSGAEIGLASLQAALGQADQPAEGFNQSVWDRWNALPPNEQADEFVKSNEKLVQTYETLDEATRNEAKIDLGFLPAPVDVATAASFRLNEFGLHSWDVRVAADPAATVAAEAVEPMLGTLPFLLGWIGKSAGLGHEVKVAVHTTAPERKFGLDITDKVALTETPAEPEATLTLPAESWIRLATGRLGADHTPAEVTATGTLGLDELRQIFPGF